MSVGLGERRLTVDSVDFGDYYRFRVASGLLNFLVVSIVLLVRIAKQQDIVSNWVVVDGVLRVWPTHEEGHCVLAILAWLQEFVVKLSSLEDLHFLLQSVGVVDKAPDVASCRE